MQGKIVNIGSANVDLIMELPHLPRKGESVTGGPFNQNFGGKGSNQALAASRSGSQVTAVFSIGADSFGQQLLATYKGEGIDTRLTVAHADVGCGTAMVYVDSQGENCIGFCMGANALLSRDQVLRAEGAIAAATVVMMQMEIPDEPMQAAVNLAWKHGVRVMMNYAPYRKSGLDLSERIAIMAVNETEAEQLTGIGADTLEGAREAAATLAKNGHQLAIVTLGSNGSIVHEAGKSTHYPAFGIKAVDATAAGDSYCGALATALAEGRTVPDAVRFASAAGALSAGRKGALTSVPIRADIDRFLAENS